MASGKIREPRETGSGETPGLGGSGETPGLGGSGETPGLGGSGETPGLGGSGETPGLGGSGETPGLGGSGATPGLGGSGATPGLGGSGATPGLGGSGATPGLGGSGATPGLGGSGATPGLGGSGARAGCPPRAVCLVTVGMAGAGKSSFIQRLAGYLHSQRTPPYVINLDPAVHELPFPANIDIRDTVNYKEVMKQYGLGPNGGIVTSLNLFATRIDQVMKFIEKRQQDCRFVLIDTPGQIEVFTWSASGTIITEALASTFATVIIYVMDTSRSTNPVTFMSNMLYACSILYKTKLPFIVAMNKTDIVDHSFAVEWMNDFESFQDAVNQETTFASNLTRSLSLVLEEFYNHLRVVGVSAMTGSGMDELFSHISDAVAEYESEYRPHYEKILREQAETHSKERAEQLEKLHSDLGNVAVDSQILHVSAGEDGNVSDGEPGPSGLILTRGIEDQESDSDSDRNTDTDDHQKIEESREEPAFHSYLEERKRKLKLRSNQ